MTMSTQQVLPVVRVAELPSEEIAERWLVEQLWCARSVGVIGGAPKCAKTWLGLDIALSVATGTPCLGKYNVPERGPVLVYLAEDALRSVRERIEGMARHRGLDLEAVEIHVITAPVLRLDHDRDRTRLWETVRRLRPRLLVLDPLVRLHSIDENHAGDVAELLESTSVGSLRRARMFWRITPRDREPPGFRNDTGARPPQEPGGPCR